MRIDFNGVQRFVDAHGKQEYSELVDRIFDEAWSRSNMRDVVFTNSHQHDACNYTYYGYVVHNKTELWYFIIDIGDYTGTVMRKFGTAEEVGEYQPPQPETYTFVPMDDALEAVHPSLYSVYLTWREENWFKSLEYAYNYDCLLTSKEAADTKYKQRLSRHGLKIVPLSVFNKEVMYV